MGFFDNFTKAGRLRNRLEVKYLEAEIEVAESTGDLIANIVNPLEPFIDHQFGGLFLPLAHDQRRNGDDPNFFINETQHAMIRLQGRRLGSKNEFAINAIENLISHTVGRGMTYTIVKKEGSNISDEVVGLVQGSVDDFLAINKWGLFEQEIVKRANRDGEAFLRIFVDSGRPNLVRFIEPEEIQRPTTNTTDTFGIRTDDDDVTIPIGYWVNGELIDAKEIVHIKLNVDQNVKRGINTFFPIRPNLERAEKLLRNMSTVAAIQAAIAMIRKTAAPKASVERFADDKSDFKVRNASTGQEKRWKGIDQPRIIDAPVGQDYDFPGHGVNADAFVGVLQADLRAAASRLVMPEFMFTGDASNSNFSSTLIAESPFIRKMERDQNFYEIHFEEIVWMSVAHDVISGRLEISPEALDEMVLQIEAPQLEVRDRKKETERRQILGLNGLLSRQTWSAQEGLDPAKEQANMEADLGDMAPPLPNPGDPEPDDGPDEDPEDENAPEGVDFGDEKAVVQNLILSKEHFPTLESAREWVRENGYKTRFKGKGPRETSYEYHFRQLNPMAVVVIETKKSPEKDGVSTVYGIPK